MLDELITLAEQIFPADRRPRWVEYLSAARLVAGGAPVLEVAASHSLNRAKLNRLASERDTLPAVLGINPSGITDPTRQRAVKQMGQMLLGVAAERAFKSKYEQALVAQGLHLTDLREGRTSTDYRVTLGDRTWCKLNIKFHGTRFQNAMSLVGLEPEDTFALATYKIYGADEQQSRDGIPHVFAIVGVPDISAKAIGEAIPQRLTEPSALVAGATKADIRKRDFEDAIVSHIAETNTPPFLDTCRRIAMARWYMLSGAKAMRLVKEKLFQRVYALRVHAFTRNYPTAEVDMHFSLKDDLVPFEEFLEHLEREGAAGMLRQVAEGLY